MDGRGWDFDGGFSYQGGWNGPVGRLITPLLHYYPVQSTPTGWPMGPHGPGPLWGVMAGPWGSSLGICLENAWPEIQHWGFAWKSPAKESQVLNLHGKALSRNPTS